MPMTEPLGQPDSAYQQHVRKWLNAHAADGERCHTAEAKANGTELELTMLDIIGVDWWTGDGVTGKWVKRQLDANPDVTVIRVLLDSPGGVAFEGVAIHNLLKRHKARVEVEVIGEASSAASVIAMAGDVIKMHEGSAMMIHRAASCMCGFAEDMRTAADALDVITSGITDIYESRTGRSRAEIDAMVTKETWMSARDAVKQGFATEVVKAGSKPTPAVKTKAKNSAGFPTEGVVQFQMNGQMFEFDLATSVARPVASSLAAGIDPQNPTTAPDGAPTETTAPQAQEEDRPMSQNDTMTTIRALLGLGAGTPDSDVIAAVTRLRELESVCLTATGAKSTEEAKGGITAMKSKVEKFDANAEELAQVKSERDKQNFESLVAQGLTVPAKLTPAMATFEREQFEAALVAGTGAQAVERFRGWLKNAPVVIASAPKQVRAGSAAATDGATLVTAEGKSYEQLSYAAKAKLKQEQPELFALMHEDWERRGKPTKAA